MTGDINGREILIACSNDYLGLAQHPLMAENPAGKGSGSSRLISGSRPLHRDLEAAIEEWIGARALVFPSGFQANLAVFSTVCEADQTIASDALNHASIIDGLRLSKAKKHIVQHLNPANIPKNTDLIAIEGLEDPSRRTGPNPDAFNKA